mmetsp:Transcript_124/g.315  ORF Transcript_124/g.315 Transcript_124/m.315 type:complete len:322 (+) Transcript_124:1286-2251(+)
MLPRPSTLHSFTPTSSARGAATWPCRCFQCSSTAAKSAQRGASPAVSALTRWQQGRRPPMLPTASEGTPSMSPSVAARRQSATSAGSTSSAAISRRTRSCTCCSRPNRRQLLGFVLSPRLSAPRAGRPPGLATTLGPLEPVLAQPSSTPRGSSTRSSRRPPTLSPGRCVQLTAAPGRPQSAPTPSRRARCAGADCHCWLISRPRPLSSRWSRRTLCSCLKAAVASGAPTPSAPWAVPLAPSQATRPPRLRSSLHRKRSRQGRGCASGTTGSSLRTTWPRWVIWVSLGSGPRSRWRGWDRSGMPLCGCWPTMRRRPPAAREE